ncbi:carbonic anhydrase 9 isoform X2 [Bufo bufo]|uniref:carbonic anhydrase 9 isoform X1 n=1 Tax=Bufo bufo TaxID=8384 RepID=UPI001ABDA6AF|nr:carbonic anhydrase 9 isoform X1 [Bufo bufo]XP_040276617.1 carbonic anhydrase 9 isoform X2 [Bufo bufo]
MRTLPDMGLGGLRSLLLLTCVLGPHVRAEGSQEDEDHEAHPSGPGHHHWGYTDMPEWDKYFPECGGTAQSPINVDIQNVAFDPWLRPIQLSGYNLTAGGTLKLENNMHTVVLKLPDSLKIVGGLPHIYEAAQLHFHWGSDSSPGSEHTVNGIRFPGEIHVVYFNSEYQSIDQALNQSGGLAVLAAFIEEGPEDNEAYEHLLSHLEEVKDGGESREIPGFDIRGLLPQQLDRYFRYNGSLTTPPCLQTVNWTIFNQTVPLSARQLAILEDTIHHDHDHILQMNFREPQALNGRVVLSSFRAPVGGRKAPGVAPPASPSDTDDPSSRNTETGSHGQENPSLGIGDMLAIIFGILFGITAMAFYIYVRKSHKRNHRSSDSKSNVIYKAATLMRTWRDRQSSTGGWGV